MHLLWRRLRGGSSGSCGGGGGGSAWPGHRWHRHGGGRLPAEARGGTHEHCCHFLSQSFSWHDKRDNKLLKTLGVTFTTHQPLVVHDWRWTSSYRLFTLNCSLLALSCCFFWVEPVQLSEKTGSNSNDLHRMWISAISEYHLFYFKMLISCTFSLF